MINKFCKVPLWECSDVAIHSGRIALVGDAKHCIGEGTRVKGLPWWL